MSVARSREDIEGWLRTAIAAELHVDAASIEPHRPVTFYGVDSLTAATLSGDLEDWLGRPMPDDLLADHVSIEALAARLAGREARPIVQPALLRPSDAIDYSALDYGRAAAGERVLRRLATIAVRATTALDVEGLERVPPGGALLIACNHLHILDMLWMATVLPRRAIFLVAEEFERKPVVGRLLNVARPIYIGRGRADHRALDQAQAVLGSGGALVVAPEGRLSRTGGLIQGQSGIAYIASRARVPILPAVLYGQERAGRSWRRISRVRVHARFGEPIPAPPAAATQRELDAYTDEIMRGLARILPAQYQGRYRLS